MLTRLTSKNSQPVSSAINELTGYIVLDTQLILGGKNAQYQIGIDDYCLAGFSGCKVCSNPWWFWQFKTQFSTNHQPRQRPPWISTLTLCSSFCTYFNCLATDAIDRSPSVREQTQYHHDKTNTGLPMKRNSSAVQSIQLLVKQFGQTMISDAMNHLGCSVGEKIAYFFYFMLLYAIVLNILQSDVLAQFGLIQSRQHCWCRRGEPLSEVGRLLSGCISLSSRPPVRFNTFHHCVQHFVSPWFLLGDRMLLAEQRRDFRMPPMQMETIRPIRLSRDTFEHL